MIGRKVHAWIDRPGMERLVGVKKSRATLKLALPRDL